MFILLVKYYYFSRVFRVAENQLVDTHSVLTTKSCAEAPMKRIGANSWIVTQRKFPSTQHFCFHPVTKLQRDEKHIGGLLYSATSRQHETRKH